MSSAMRDRSFIFAFYAATDASRCERQWIGLAYSVAPQLQSLRAATSEQATHLNALHRHLRHSRRTDHSLCAAHK
jgi:hypothetical protein